MILNIYQFGEMYELKAQISNLNEEIIKKDEEIIENDKTLDGKMGELGREISKLNKEIIEKDKKLDFFDSYVVFVEDDGSNLYHNYDCYRFLGNDFWAFNIDAAKDEGYRACSVCNP